MISQLVLVPVSCAAMSILDLIVAVQGLTSMIAFLKGWQNVIKK